MFHNKLLIRTFLASYALLSHCFDSVNADARILVEEQNQNDLEGKKGHKVKNRKNLRRVQEWEYTGEDSDSFDREDGRSDNATSFLDEIPTDFVKESIGDENWGEYPIHNTTMDYIPMSTLDVCMLNSESELYQDANGTAISRIPVKKEAFDAGIFLEDTTESICDGQNGSMKPHCRKFGHQYCGLCVFNTSLFEENALFKALSGEIPKCRDEISNIAETCKVQDCHEVLSSSSEWSVDIGIGNKNATSLSDVNSRRNLLSSSSVLGNNKARWISALGSNLGEQLSKEVTLKDFVLPGSHNSAASDMVGSEWCDKNAGSFWSSLKANQVSRCQNLSLENQLNQGIRYLDLRVVDTADFDGKGRYPLHHTYLARGPDGKINTMEKALIAVTQFLDRNPNEFVVARMKGSTCDNDGLTYGGWKDEFRRLAQNSGRIEIYTDKVLGFNLSQLRGKFFVDINGLREELYTFGKGVDGVEYDVGEGNPFEVVRSMREKRLKNDYGKFNVWSFFPAASESQLIWSALDSLHNGIADWDDLGNLFVGGSHGGIAEWDENFQKHVWLMHTLIAHEGKHVTAIQRDFATRRKSIYHVATQLTLYRVFEKVRSTKPWLDTVVTHEWVNEWDEKFEHRCPKGWILGGLQSRHDNDKEDRLWKFQCKKVDWLENESLWWDSNQRKWRSDLHDVIWYKKTETGTGWDETFDLGWSNCRNAITGIGGRHSNHHEDRRFWFYRSVVKGSHSDKCQWTGWINEFDRLMDTSVANNKYIGQIHSVHDNGKEDRRFKLCLCTKYKYEKVDNYDYNRGWRVEKHLRLLADVNGDGKLDIVGFGGSKVLVTLAAPYGGFEAPKVMMERFTYNSGWSVEKHPRFLADVNGDGRADIVGFYGADVFVSFSYGTGFTEPEKVVNNLGGMNDDWSVKKHPRFVTDMNGDGKADIVGFGENHIYVAYANGSGFDAPIIISNSFVYASGWRVEKHLRFLEDVNGDGKKDIIGIFENEVYVSYSNGNGWDAPKKMIENYGYSQGWKIEKHPRFVTDMNGDGKADIVGFGGNHVFVSYSNGNGFNAQIKISNSFVSESGWRVGDHPRFLEDVNGDGKKDIIGIYDDGVYVSISNDNGGWDAPLKSINNYGHSQGWQADMHPRFVADMNGDGYADVVGFGGKATYIRSLTQ